MENLIVRGAVFLARLNSAVGSEQKGYRPVLVIQNDIGNKFSPTTVIVPISAKKKNELPTHISITNNKIFDYSSVALVEQVRTIDKKRLVKYLGLISKKDLEKISYSIGIELGIDKKFNS